MIEITKVEKNEKDVVITILKSANKIVIEHHTIHISVKVLQDLIKCAYVR